MTSRHRGIPSAVVRRLCERVGVARGRWNAVACAYCAGLGTVDWTRDPPDFHGLSIDHVVSRARGGADDLANLTIACRPCNLVKGGGYLPFAITNGPHAHPIP